MAETSWGWYIFIFIVVIIIHIVLAANAYYWYQIAYATNVTDIVTTTVVSSGTATFLFWVNIIIFGLGLLLTIFSLIYYFVYADDEVVEPVIDAVMPVQPVVNPMMTNNGVLNSPSPGGGNVVTELQLQGINEQGKRVYKAGESYTNIPVNVEATVRPEVPRVNYSIPIQNQQPITTYAVEQPMAGQPVRTYVVAPVSPVQQPVQVAVARPTTVYTNSRLGSQ